MQENLEIITSRKNPSVMFAASLADKKQRDRSGLFAFEGFKLLEDALRSGTEIDRVFVTERAYGKYKTLLSAVADKITVVTDEVYAKFSFENAPQGVFTVAKKKERREMEYTSDSFVLFLDAVGDPGNLGTIIRSADAFGVDTVFVGKGSADIYNPKTVRASMGSLFRVDIKVCDDIASDISALKQRGFDIYAAMLDPDSENLLDIELEKGNIGFVVGNEGHGISADVRDACGKSVIIPMCQGPESLNAAISASVLCWEVFRVRG
jgi:TrmH family RNA methyltransferase